MAILMYTRWNLSFIILWVSCGKKSGKKSDCNSSRDILFHFTSFYKYQLCKKHKNILFSINVQLCKNAANVLSFFFIERDNVIETICSSCFLFLCVFHTINFAHFFVIRMNDLWQGKHTRPMLTTEKPNITHCLKLKLWSATL